MSAQPAIIPFEKQSDPQTNRMCGAACLSMVYRSFGSPVPQEEIWPAIAKENRFGSLASTTHLMAADAVKRGFSALAIQARHPLLSLRLCLERGFRAILNHRFEAHAPSGHYTVFVDMDEKSVVVHDPFRGPARRLSHAELLDLWQPGLVRSEIAGYVLIGIADHKDQLPPCDFCHTSIPETLECPQCRQPVTLQPAALLRCINPDCIARMWNYVFCPACDYGWNFGGRGPAAMTGAASPQVAPAAAEARQLKPVDLAPLFAELDKFCGQIMGLPGAANNLDVKQKMDLLASAKEQLKVAQSEALTHLQGRQEFLAKQQEEVAQKLEEHRKKMEELNTPAVPLDGIALGRALFKTLGFTE